MVEKDFLAAVAARGRMIERASVFDAQRTCHDAKMAGWDHVGMLDLTPCALHPVFVALAGEPAARRGAYRALFRGKVDDRQLGGIRSASQSGTPLGDARFRARIERLLDVKIGHDRRGRPRTRPAAESRIKGL